MTVNSGGEKATKKTKHKAFLYFAIACFVVAIIGAIIVIAVL